MAQWNGQFTGNSHSTKVKDLEEMLAHAVNIYREINSTDEKIAKEKAIYKIVEKLLTARLKLLKAKLNDAEPVIEEKAKKQAILIEHLRQEIVQTQIEGTNGILVEFGIEDLVK